MKVLQVNRIVLFLLLLGMILACQHKKKETENFGVSIDFWYGENQIFGNQGIPQKWINILGNIHAEAGIKSAWYRLNDGDSIILTLGSDLHRLAEKGDFNIDFAYDHCEAGTNKVHVFMQDSAGRKAEETIEIEVIKNKKWPLPYTIKWSEVENIQDVVQVTDGHWEITTNGLQNSDIYYDRMVVFGDALWKNYEVTTTVTFHDFIPPTQGPPTYNVSHTAIASRWPGHSKDNLQPHRQWYPLGATSEFRLTAGLDSCRWRIFDGPKPNSVRFYVEQPVDDYRTIELNKTYGMKHRVESIGEGETRYRVKLWPFDQQEPAEWDFSGIEKEENIHSGSAALLAHNTSVTFGDIDVQPID